MSSNDQYPGNPSEKYLEEKLKLNEVIANMHKIEDAIPLIHQIFREQGRQSDTMLSHQLQMKELITFEEMATKFSAFSLDMETLTMKRIKQFQASIVDMSKSQSCLRIKIAIIGLITTYISYEFLITVDNITHFN